MLEEEFLELMVHLFRNLPMGDIWQTENRHRQAEHGDQEAEILHNLQVCPLQKSSSNSALDSSATLYHLAGPTLDVYCNLKHSSLIAC